MIDKKLAKQFEYENQILEVIDRVDDFTRSDLQGVISAIVRRIMRESGEELLKKGQYE